MHLNEAVGMAAIPSSLAKTIPEVLNDPSLSRITPSLRLCQTAAPSAELVRSATNHIRPLRGAVFHASEAESKSDVV